LSKRTQSFLSTNFPKVRTCLLVVTFLNFFWAQSQDSLVKAGYLIDCETLQPIPYGTIFTQEDRRGTISRQNGFFRIENLTKNDSLNFRAIGFTNLRLGLNEIFDTIFLCPKTQLLDDVIVLADTSFLFELVTKARKTQTTNARTSKAYFELQSFENEKQIELFQGYYNGKIQGYELTGLELKTAKFGLRRNKGRYFISTEASKAICLHQIFEESQYFPGNPFEMNKRNIRKNYLLQLSNKYKKPDGSVIYVIRFIPREDSGNLFSGTAWLDSASQNLQKINLIIDRATSHPFQMLFNRAELDSVSIQLSKTFNQKEDFMELQSVDFQYQIHFEKDMYMNLRADSSIISLDTISKSDRYEIVPKYTIESQAILYVYNSDGSFDMPLFNFPNEMISDYRKLYVLDNSEQFWSCYSEFKIPNNAENLSFLSSTDVVSDLDSIFSQEADRKLLMGRYISWSENRILLKENPEKIAQNTIPALTYHLKAQILLDIISDCDSAYYTIKTVFDPYESYYNRKLENTDVAFINIYFDLIEWKKRELNEKLKTVQSPEKWKEMYSKHLTELEQLEKIYFKEVDHGVNRQALFKWNDLIRSELQIDNCAIFAVDK